MCPKDKHTTNGYKIVLIPSVKYHYVHLHNDICIPLATPVLDGP